MALLFDSKILLRRYYNREISRYVLMYLFLRMFIAFFIIVNRKDLNFKNLGILMWISSYSYKEVLFENVKWTMGIILFEGG